MIQDLAPQCDERIDAERLVQLDYCIVVEARAHQFFVSPIIRSAESNLYILYFRFSVVLRVSFRQNVLLFIPPLACRMTTLCLPS
ncbi:MAG: hypothetical protein ABIM50_01010 [Novosphingobium sp.]